MPKPRTLKRKRTSYVGKDHYAWKGDETTPTVKRKRAQRLYAADQCEKCGGSPAERHHKDTDTGNNAPENIAILCRRCHMAEDGRLAKLAATHPEALPARPCVTCSVLATRFWHGQCHKCNEYERRNGTKRPAVANIKESRKVFGECPNCHRHGQLSTQYGTCTRCYRAKWARDKRSNQQFRNNPHPGKFQANEDLPGSF